MVMHWQIIYGKEIPAYARNVQLKKVSYQVLSLPSLNFSEYFN